MSLKRTPFVVYALYLLGFVFGDLAYRNTKVTHEFDNEAQYEYIFKRTESFSRSISIAICDFHHAAHSNIIRARNVTKEPLHRKYRDEALNNHRDYAIFHNYSYVRRKLPLRSFDQPLINTSPPAGVNNMWVHWSKVPLLNHLISAPYKFDWVLWIDSDAVFKNMSIRIEDILKQYGVPFDRNDANVPDLIFSGDTNIINTGVLLIRNSDWSRQMLKEVYKMGQLVDKFGTDLHVGMGGDNAMFSCYLAGCNSTISLTYADYKRCYDRVDIGYLNGRKTPSASLISNANSAIFKRLVSADIMKHIRPLPQVAFNGYEPDKAMFIVHFSGPRNKGHLLEVIDEAKNTFPKVA